jgi:hypothetical protein
MKLTYVIDLDHTLCDTQKKEDGNWDYVGAKPFIDRILKINELYDKGNEIIIETARGCVSGKDWYETTFQQLQSWGLKFSKLRTGVKFAADFYVDDKGINSEDFFDK